MEPFGTAVAPDGTVYVSDRSAQRIVRIDALRGTVDVVAGGGVPEAGGLRVPGGFANGTASSARFDSPGGLAFAGTALLIADTGNHCIRRLEHGVVTTFAGTCGSAGTTDGAAPVARFAAPLGIATTPSGAVYVGDAVAGLRKIEASGRVVTIPTPSKAAYFVAFDARSGMLFVTAPDDLVVVHDDVPINGVKLAKPAATGYLAYNYNIGSPFGIVALSPTQVLYTDVVTGALRYLETDGSTEVLSGRAEGGDFRVAGRSDGPLRADSFVEPVGLALAPDRSVIVADRFARTVRRIASWDDVTRVRPDTATIPRWTPHRFRIAYVGNSTIWNGTTWYDSIENRLREDLDTPAFVAKHGVPEVLPFLIVGPRAFGASADYAQFLAAEHLADAIVLQQNSIALMRDPIPAGCSDLDFGAPWLDGRTSIEHLGATARAEHVPAVFVELPVSFDVSPTEQIGQQFRASFDAACIRTLRSQTRRFHAELPALLARAGLRRIDLWPTFEREELRPDALPLFGSYDAHFTARARRLVADSIAASTAAAIDASQP
ncbi:MAG TPA: hypothetical protein VFB22_07020 [Candidatus Baltobacteraceae bacterium]|nr:hypothetical protein [Candidatus Baltobacteraceae bacterium]